MTSHKQRSFGNRGVYTGVMGVTQGTVLPHPAGLKTGFLLGCLIAVFNSTKSRVLRKTWEQICSTTKEGWAVERLSLELRKPVFPTYLTHSFKRGSKKLQVSFLKVSPLSEMLNKHGCKVNSRHPAAKRS